MVSDVIKILAIAILSLMMIGMGMSLTVADFKRVFRKPKAVCLGVALQLLLIPLVGFILVLAIPVAPEIAIGLMILSGCPGGPGSNLVAFMVDGDTALSVSLTAISSLYTAFTLPIIAALAISQLGGTQMSVELPLWSTTLKLFLIAVVPVAIGMGVKLKWPKLAQRMLKPVKLMSVVALLVLVAHIFSQQWENLPSLLSQAGGHGLLLCWITLIGSYLIARLLKLSKPERRSIAIEVGIQNAALAIVVTTTFIGNNVMAIPALVYSPVMISMAAILFGANLMTKRGGNEGSLNTEVLD